MRMPHYSSFAGGLRLLALASLIGLAACGDDGAAGTGKGGSGGKGGTGGRGGSAGATGVAGAGGSVGGSSAGSAGSGGSAGATAGSGGGGTAGASGSGGSAGSGGATGAGGSGGSAGASGTGGTAGAAGSAGSGGVAGGNAGDGGSGGTGGSAGAAGSAGGSSGGTTDAGTGDAGDGPVGAANGTACTAAAACASGYCVDGFCCDTACTGICSSCAGATTGQANGVCRPIGAGTDPENECPQEAPSTCQHDGMCDGNGACRNWAVGITCATESCSAGTYTPARICNGAGTCLSVTTMSCGLYTCGASTCKTMCSTAADCITGHYCAGTTCAPLKAQGAACSSSVQCATGSCVDNVCCESACAGGCMACAGAKTGATDGLCRNVSAGTDPDNDCTADNVSTCGLDGQCDGAGACRKFASGTACVAESCSGTTYTPARTCDGAGVCQTVSNSSCNAYVCGATACKTACATSGDCAAGNYCAGTTCVPLKAQGAACTSGGECGTGSCVDNVCCETACAGSCMACAGAKTAAADGLCRVIIGGTDPDNECAQEAQSTCGQDGTCDGAGACRKWTSGTTCIGESCSVSTYQPASTCNGAGTCQTPATTPCGAFMCGATACATSCGSNSDCTAGYHCATGLCVPQEQNGTACLVAGDCGSGYCVDGVCCNTACTGTCNTCAATNSLGTCKAADAGTDPRVECSASDPSTCGDDGTCDGAGACRKYVAGTVCLAAGCSSATLHAASTCNGTGTCNAGANTSCGAYQCDALNIACATTCANDAGCNAAFCAASTCYASPLNLAGNGDVEYGNTSNWTTNGGVTLAIQSGAGLVHSGTYSIADTARDQNYEGPGQNIPTGAGIYNISAWAMQNQNATQNVALQVNLQCGGSTGVIAHFPTIGAYGTPLPMGVWTRIQGTVNLGADADCNPAATPTAGVVRSAMVYLNQTNTSTVAFPNLFLDDLVVTPAAAGQNLVGNPNFEAGVASGWAASGGGTLAISNTVFRSGANSLVLSGRTQTFAGPKWNLPNAPAKYNVTVYGLHNGSLPHNLILQPTYTCAGGGQQFPAPIVTVAGAAANTWSTLSGTVTFPPANAAATCKLSAAGIYLQQEGGTCGTGAGQIECPDLFVDDVSISLAP